MELRHGRWRLKICSLERAEYDGELDVWSVVLLFKDRRCSVDLYSLLGVHRVWLMWWGMADWGGLDTWSVRVWMFECRPVEMPCWMSACRNAVVAGARCVDIIIYQNLYTIIKNISLKMLINNKQNQLINHIVWTCVRCHHQLKTIQLQVDVSPPLPHCHLKTI